MNGTSGMPAGAGSDSFGVGAGLISGSVLSTVGAVSIVNDGIDSEVEDWVIGV